MLIQSKLTHELFYILSKAQFPWDFKINSDFVKIKWVTYLGNKSDAIFVITVNNKSFLFGSENASDSIQGILKLLFLSDFCCVFFRPKVWRSARNHKLIGLGLSQWLLHLILFTQKIPRIESTLWATNWTSQPKETSRGFSVDRVQLFDVLGIFW